MVPGCEKCRKKDEEEDTHVRNIICSERDVENHSYVKKHVQDRVTRSLENDKRILSEFANLLTFKQAKENKGLLLPAIDYDDPVFDRFVERVARALVFKELGQEYFEGEFEWRMNFDDSKEMFFHMDNHFGSKNVMNIFRYSVLPRTSKSQSWVYFEFYNSLPFLVKIKYKLIITSRNEKA